MCKRHMSCITRKWLKVTENWGKHHVINLNTRQIFFLVWQGKCCACILLRGTHTVNTLCCIHQQKQEACKYFRLQWSQLVVNYLSRFWRKLAALVKVPLIRKIVIAKCCTSWAYRQCVLRTRRELHLNSTFRFHNTTSVFSKKKSLKNVPKFNNLGTELTDSNESDDNSRMKTILRDVQNCLLGCTAV
jgi:hypothetical protein